MVRSEKSQKENSPNFSNLRPEFCPEFCQGLGGQGLKPENPPSTPPGVWLERLPWTGTPPPQQKKEERFRESICVVL